MLFHLIFQSRKKKVIYIHLVALSYLFSTIVNWLGFLAKRLHVLGLSFLKNRDVKLFDAWYYFRQHEPCFSKTIKILTSLAGLAYMYDLACAGCIVGKNWISHTKYSLQISIQLLGPVSVRSWPHRMTDLIIVQMDPIISFGLHHIPTMASVK